MTESPLDEWMFLIGEWKGGSKEQFGGTGEIVSTAVFTLELNGRFIRSRIDSHRNGKLENASIGYMWYDVRNKKFLQKVFFSYGFVNNCTEIERTEDKIVFEVVSEPTPQAFDNMRWRSYIIKVSDTEIREGLEVAKDDGDFENYGDSVLKKVE